MINKTIIITDQMETIPLVKNTEYIIQNITNTHVIFGFTGDYKIGDECRITGKQLGDSYNSCSWILEFPSDASIAVDFGDIKTTTRIVGTSPDSLIMNCVSTNPLVFRATSDKGRLQIDETAGMKG